MVKEINFQNSKIIPYDIIILSNDNAIFYYNVLFLRKNLFFKSILESKFCETKSVIPKINIETDSKTLNTFLNIISSLNITKQHTRVFLNPLNLHEIIRISHMYQFGKIYYICMDFILYPEFGTVFCSLNMIENNLKILDLYKEKSNKIKYIIKILTSDYGRSGVIKIVTRYLDYEQIDEISKHFGKENQQYLLYQFLLSYLKENNYENGDIIYDMIIENNFYNSHKFFYEHVRWIEANDVLSKKFQSKLILSTFKHKYSDKIDKKLLSVDEIDDIDEYKNIIFRKIKHIAGSKNKCKKINNLQLRGVCSLLYWLECSNQTIHDYELVFKEICDIMEYKKISYYNNDFLKTLLLVDYHENADLFIMDLYNYLCGIQCDDINFH